VSYLSKVADFNLSHLHLVSPLRGTPLEFRQGRWLQKTRVPGLSCRVVDVIPRLAVDTIPACDGHTDRQTDTHTHRHTTTAYIALA